MLVIEFLAIEKAMWQLKKDCGNWKKDYGD